MHAERDAHGRRRSVPRGVHEISSCLRRVPPPCQPCALDGDSSIHDGDDDDGAGDDDDDCDGDDDDDDGEEEEEEACHTWRFSLLPP